MVAGPGAILVVALVLVAMAIPVVVIILAMRGGSHMPRIVAVVSYAVMVGIAVMSAVTAIVLMSGAPVSITVPVSPLKPFIATGVTLDRVAPVVIEDGGLDSASLVVTGLPMTTRVVMLIGMLIAATTAIAVCVVILRLARSVMTGNPFALGTKALTATGWILLVGGFAASVVSQIGNVMASWDVFGFSGGSATGSWNPTGSFAGPGWPEPATFGLLIPWWPLGGALVLALVAGVFKYGERLHRDSEGLV